MLPFFVSKHLALNEISLFDWYSNWRLSEYGYTLVSLDSILIQ